MSSQTINAFFYGTLMHPKILQRVIGNDGLHLSICPAVLLDHTRHMIKSADYPGVVPYERSRDTLLKDSPELPQEGRCVRGTLVTGLTKEDIGFLDYFEGVEYTRDPVTVYPLDTFKSSSDYSKEFEKLVPIHPPLLPALSDLPPPVNAETYIFNDVDRLEATPWSFTEFIECNAWKWYGKGAESNEDITEVDRRRERSRLEMISTAAA